MQERQYKRERKMSVVVMSILVIALIALFVSSGRSVYLWAIIVAVVYTGIVLGIEARKHRAELNRRK